MSNQKNKLGFGALSAIILGSMIGSGIFNLPQNMAVNASPLAVGIAWLITALGMLLIVATFKILCDRRPDLNAGIYQYAQKGWGNYAGFNMAWGYWLSTAFANVAYAIMLNDSFGAFFPMMLQHRWPTLLFGTFLIWGVFFIVSRGVRTAHAVNKALTVLKVLSLTFVIILFIIGFRAEIFTLNFSEFSVNGNGIMKQISNSMLVTLWCFIGIEGAVMMAAQAKKSSDVGKATILGFFIAWLLYVLVSLLCYGAMARAKMAGIHDPSAAYVLRYVFGEWAYWIIIISVILSILGVWIAWTIVGAEVPYEAARCGIFPKIFLKKNCHGVPKAGLILLSIIMKSFFIVVLFSEDVYMTTLSITGMMILPAYLASGYYLCRECINNRGRIFDNKGEKWRTFIIGIGCVIFCVWMIYAGGWKLFIFTSWFYLIGSGIYLQVRKQKDSVEHTKFTCADKITISILIAAAVTSGVLLLTGFKVF